MLKNHAEFCFYVDLLLLQEDYPLLVQEEDLLLVQEDYLEEDFRFGFLVSFVQDFSVLASVSQFKPCVESCTTSSQNGCAVEKLSLSSFHADTY